MQDPFQTTPAHCFVDWGATTASNLMTECPNYTCANIIDDEMREECLASGPEAQRELLNIIGGDNPTGLNPMPLNAAGQVPTPPDTGPCAGSSMPTTCNALLKSALWFGDQTEWIRDKPPPDYDSPVGCICIRG